MLRSVTAVTGRSVKSSCVPDRTGQAVSERNVVVSLVEERSGLYWQERR